MVTVIRGDGANTMMSSDTALPRSSGDGAGDHIGKAPTALTNIALQCRAVAPSEHGVGEIPDGVTLAEVFQGRCDVLDQRLNHALRRGGLRWAHAEGDALAFLRESERQRLLVLAARAGHRPLRLPTGALGLGGEAPNLYGDGDPLRPDPDGSVTLPGDGPTFQLWQLA